jgi:SNF2 family DNA or RNA helicase
VRTAVSAIEQVMVVEKISTIRGAIVRVRRARWRVVDVRPYDGCSIVTLAGLAPPQAGRQRRVITPFDAIEPVDRARRPRLVKTAAWTRACRALIAADTPPASLRSAARARIDLLSYQLEPALAIVRGIGCRVLLADEVGLGKTIQAGLIAGELREREAIERLLVLAPAGLRDQWVAELRDRFAIEAALVDATSLRRAASMLPIDLNPWTTLPAAVSSIDYVKRPEVLPAVAACSWDLVIVDEAHASAADSDRRAAVHALCSRASYVLLLTATPHNGDQRTFESLCAIGSVSDDSEHPLIVFRRTRRDAGMAATRRVHTLRVRTTAEEQRVHRALARYSRAVRAERGDACLALSVLHKRALSSAWALAESIDRRLRMLSTASDPAASGQQLTLPLFDINGDVTPEDDAPAWPEGVGLADAEREQRLLGPIVEAARTAAGCESKVAALNRLLRRVHESIVVFTEYRDTLQHIHALLGRTSVVLHGGLSREERARALNTFVHRPRSVLLATDAAGEGLNLHHSCRAVINLELPWNPMRLEQRIGRVDRIGQTRTVHAFHLVADGTGEIRILARLRERVEAAQAAIGAPDPLGIAEIAIDEP